MPPPNLDQINAVLSLIDREVWVITAAAAGKRGGLAATWVASASLDRSRPGLVVGITPTHFTAELIDAAGGFAAHLLRDDQHALAWNFAHDSGKNRDKLAGLEIATDASEWPILTDCLAWCDCRVFARHDAGDRRLYWADIVAGGTPSLAPPLREQSFLRQLSTDQRQTLAASRAADWAACENAYLSWRQTAQHWLVGKKIGLPPAEMTNENQACG